MFLPFGDATLLETIPKPMLSSDALPSKSVLAYPPLKLLTSIVKPVARYPERTMASAVPVHHRRCVRSPQVSPILGAGECVCGSQHGAHADIVDDLFDAACVLCS
jgi:hypothetical protein